MEEARNLNKNGLNYSDTTSEDTGDDPRRQRASRFNFNVPPPTLPLSPNGQPFFQQPQQSIARSLIPPPLNLNRIEQAYVHATLCSPAICEERSCPGFGGPLTPCCCDDCLALQQNMVNLQTSGFLPIVRTPEVTTPVMVNTPVPNFIMSPLMGPTATPALPAAMTPTVLIPTTTSAAAVMPGLRRPVFQFPSPVVTPLTTSINPEGNVFVFPTLPTENPRNMMPMPHPRQGP